METKELGEEVVSEQPSYVFDIFLSYSRKDRDFATRLENALESYKFPKSLKTAKRNLNVFRDEADIQAGENYERIIEQHLKGSAKLVVVCSPDARQSKFVEDEIRRFIKGRGEADIIPVLVRGKANNETSDENEKAFPEVLCVNRMPLAANFLGCDTYKGKLHKGPFSNSFYSILAAINGIDRRRLEQIDERVRGRKRALALSTASVIILILSVALVFAVISQRKAVAATNLATKSAKAEKTAKDEAVEAKNRALAAAKAEEIAKNEALAAAKAEEKAKNEAVSAAKAEKKAKDEAVAAAKAEKKAKDGAVAAAEAEEIAKNEAVAAAKAEKIAKDEAVAAAKAEKKAKDEAVAAARAEEIAKNEAIAQKNNAERLLYSSNIALADEAYRSGDTERAHGFLLKPGLHPGEDSPRGFEWNYLWGLFHRELGRVVTGDIGYVTSVAFSLDGKMFATGSSGTFKIWDTASWQLRGKPYEDATKSSTGSSTAVAFSPDQKSLVTVSENIRVWDIDSHRFRTLQEGTTEGGRSVMFSRNGQMLVTAHAGTYQIWNAINYQSLLKLPPGRTASPEFLSAMAFSIDSTRIAIAVRPAVEIWDILAHRKLNSLKGPNTDLAENISYLSDGRVIVIKGSNFDLFVPPFRIDATTKPEKSGPVQLGTADIMALTAKATLAPNGKTLAVGTDEEVTSGGGVKLIDTDSFDVLQTFEGLGINGDVYSLAFSSEGDKLLIGGRHGVQLSDPRLDRSSGTWGQRDDKAILSLNTSPRDDRFATVQPLGNGPDNNGLRLWTGANSKPAESARVGTARFVAFSPTEEILASGNPQGSVTLRNLISNETAEYGLTAAARKDQSPYHNYECYAAAFSSDGARLAIGSGNVAPLQIWDIKRKKLLYGKENMSLEAKIVSVGFSPDDKVLAAYTGSGETEGLEIFRVADHDSFEVAGFIRNMKEETVTSFVFSKDSRVLMVAKRNLVELWDISALPPNSASAFPIWQRTHPRFLGTLEGHKSTITGLAISRDGKTLATASEDETIKLWSMATRQLLLTLKVKGSKATCLSFSFDNQLLLAGDANGMVHFWHAPKVPTSSVTTSLVGKRR